MTIIQDDLMKNIIEDYNSGLSPNKISEKYEEISPYQIRENLKRVGVFKNLYFTTEELEGIKLDFNLGLSLKQLVEKYNRPEETIRKKLQSLGLLDEETRHVFKYRKNGIKNGRLYCCSQLKCKSDSTTKTDVNQIMDLVLYTVENDKSTTIPPYLMRCIKNSELQIIQTMNKINSGGDDNAKKPLAVTR